jgi:hypothetical protein
MRDLAKVELRFLYRGALVPVFHSPPCLGFSIWAKRSRHGRPERLGVVFFGESGLLRAGRSARRAHAECPIDPVCVRGSS